MSKGVSGHRLAVVLSAVLTLAGGPALADTFTVNDLGDAADDNPGNGACHTAGGVCTLRAAIMEANAKITGAPHTINFSVSGTIDGGGTPSSSGTPYTTNASFVIVLDGKSFNVSGDGLRVDLGQAVPPVHPASAAAAVTIKGLVIGGFSGAGIQLVTGYNTVQGCFLGTNAAGTAASATTANGTGISITATAGDNAADGHSLIGGQGNPAFSNLISGNTTDGVDISGQSAFNVVQANVIGTNKTGTAALANGDDGVYISGDSQNNQIGGPSAPAGSFAGNLISGNDLVGTGAAVQIVGPNSTGNSV